MRDKTEAKRIKAQLLQSRLEEMKLLVKRYEALIKAQEEWLKEANNLLGKNYVTLTGASAELDKQIQLGRDYE